MTIGCEDLGRAGAGESPASTRVLPSFRLFLYRGQDLFLIVQDFCEG